MARSQGGVAQAAAGSAGFFAAWVGGDVCDVAATHFGNLDVFERLQGIVLAERPCVDGADFFDGGETPTDGKHVVFTVREVLGEEGGGGGVEGGGGRPSSLARTGSKSTNQLWNSARAIASSVAFIRRFNSILSSSAPSTAAMAFCSARGGSGMLKFGMSAHFRLSNTAPTLMKVPTCSHQSVPRTSQRKKGGNNFFPSARSRTRF